MFKKSVLREWNEAKQIRQEWGPGESLSLSPSSSEWKVSLGTVLVIVLIGAILVLCTVAWGISGFPDIPFLVM